ncbi:BatA domain-containing protein [Maioricimonas sp. JC845]|uniref:BatA domain-containing protein n=1 Tax=Maioricimonas sp. JC845 TaxID=3232138 RepID=UPI00345B4655
MATWIAQHFLNPAFFWPGVALVAAPIIIHLINRLRYRRVRFAAMEFLLSSEQRNRRRILFEQLLLLLLRILMVLLILALVGRFVLDAQQLTLFRGAKSHHVVILDDSGSMQDRLGDGTAFAAARSVVEKIVAEGAQRPGTQKFTLILLSRPGETIAGLSERDIDDALLDEVSTRLSDLQCTHRALDLVSGMDAARDRLIDDQSAVKHLHVISDFRQDDWFDNARLGETVRELDAADISVNLVRVIDDVHENLAITELTGSVEAAAAGVPVSFTATVSNYGTREAEDVRLGVFVDGQQLPMNLVFPSIEAGKDVSRTFEVVFETAGNHRLHVTLESDALEADNVRYVAVEVPVNNPVLIIDGTPGGTQGLYIADALAADTSVTGYSALVQGPDYLRRNPLEKFQAIYLVNVAELPPDAVDALEKFTAAGGGLAWFMGNTVRPAFYNDKLYQNGEGLFPIPLAGAPRELPRDDSTSPGPDLIPTDHPLFRILGGQENPFIDAVFINLFYPVAADWWANRQPEDDAFRVLATLRNRQPLILEHEYGEGRIVTCLTAAGPLVSPQGIVWNNWANGPGAPSFAVMQLELARYIARSEHLQPREPVGAPLDLTLNRAYYRENLEIVSPDNQATQLKAASPESPSDETDEPSVAADELPPLVASFRETDAPGIYTVRLTTREQQVEERLIAYNVPVEESRLDVATDETIRRQIGENVSVTIQEPGTFDWIRTESAGNEIRWWLLAALVLLAVCEQLLACRLSYHPDGEARKGGLRSPARGLRPGWTANS